MGVPALAILVAQIASDFLRDRIPGGTVLAPVLFGLIMIFSLAATFTLIPALVSTL
jgi:hypothetical protein